MNPFEAFGSSPYVSAIANAIQIASGVGAIVAWYHLSCDYHPLCLRHGRVRHGRKHYCTKHHPEMNAQHTVITSR